MCGHRRTVFAVLGILLALSLAGGAARAQAPSWDQAVTAARGQTVFWNAWGGDERINAYIAWVGKRVGED
ncbi:MAG: ABC transporter substrate-binding protein, partial [Proteobacteria bacterium]|nr:ABC transporter substrate-binding protein [Pseudomonadota bacterium]